MAKAKVSVYFRLDPELNEALENQCMTLGKGKGKTIEAAIREYLGLHAPEKPMSATPWLEEPDWVEPEALGIEEPEGFVHIDTRESPEILEAVIAARQAAEEEQETREIVYFYGEGRHPEEEAWEGYQLDAATDAEAIEAARCLDDIDKEEPMSDRVWRYNHSTKTWAYLDKE
jgi:hypothetical protein